MEKWEDIKGYEGHYKISDHGNVKSICRVVFHGKKGSIIIPEKLRKFGNAKGYKTIILKKDTVAKQLLVHRLVGEAFITNINNLPVINHLDGNKANNHVSNLEWTTQGQNIVHSYMSGTRNKKGLSQEKIDLIMANKGKKSISAVAKELHCCKKTISRYWKQNIG
jgi:hypothetical protein